MAERILVDTGPIIAILSRRDEHHGACTNQLRELRGELVTCWPVITEAAWLLRKQPQAIQRMLRAIDGGVLTMCSLDKPAAAWIAAFMDQYRELGAQLADAALAYLAEREGIGTVFTLDRRDFSVYRRSNNQPFNLIPPL